MREIELSKSIAVRDNRGIFSASSLPDCTWVQTNVSCNTHKDTFRGMHLQRAPHSQTKLLKVISGSIVDIIVDLRDKTSEDYLKVHWFTLEEGDELLVPKGFAHGFITLVENTVVQYLVDYPYTPEADVSIHWSSFPKIEHIFSCMDMVISDKDSNAPMFKDIEL